jgi:hypothetical protein
MGRIFIEHGDVHLWPGNLLRLARCLLPVNTIATRHDQDGYSQKKE